MKLLEPGNCRVDVAAGRLDGASNRYEKLFSDLAGLYEDERAFREFTSGEFGFGAGVSAVAITAAASASASTTGASTGVSGGKKDATTTGEYYKGMAVFTIAKGGLMYEAALAGQKFSYRAKKAQ